MLSYDPDKVPEIDPEAIEDAMKKGLYPVHVLCFPPAAREGDIASVSFMVFSYFLPRAGDQIGLEDGNRCVVENAFFKVSSSNTGNHKTMLSNVLARLIEPEQEE